MSVINQMLRDLDARGQGDAASRRAAMASAGQPVGHQVSSGRSRRLWWWVAAVTGGLAITAVLLVANRWQAIERVAEAGTPSDAPAPALAPAAGSAAVWAWPTAVPAWPITSATRPR